MKTPTELEDLNRLRGIDPNAEAAQRIITVMMARGAMSNQAGIVADGLGMDFVTKRRVSLWLSCVAEDLWK